MTEHEKQNLFLTGFIKVRCQFGAVNKIMINKKKVLRKVQFRLEFLIH